MDKKPNIIFAWIAKHPFLSSVFIFTTIILSFLLVLFLIQDPLLRDRNLKGLLSAVMPPDYELLAKTANKNKGFIFQDLDDGDALKHNQTLAKNKSYKYVLFTGLAANSLAVHYKEGDKSHVFWVNTGFDSQLQTTLRKVLGKRADIVEQVVLSDYIWDRTWGLRYYTSQPAYFTGKTKKTMLAKDGEYWDKFGLPGKMQKITTDTKVNWGKGSIELVPVTAGRTDSTLMVYFADEGIFYMGSVLQPYEIPRLDFALGGRLKKLRTAVESLTKDPRFQKSTILVPGRGPAMNNDNLTHYLNFLGKLIKRIELAVKSATGKSAEQIADSIDWQADFPAFPIVEDRTVDLVKSIIAENN